jgi:hypothetical protein
LLFAPDLNKGPMTEAQNETIDLIVSAIQTGKVIPIIGYDLLHYEFEKISSEDDFLKGLLKVHSNISDLAAAFPDAKTGNEYINAYYHSLPLQKQDAFKANISNTILTERLNLKVIPESLKKVVGIKQFNLFINATFTNVLEMALSTYRIQEQDSTKIRDAYVMANYRAADPQDMPEAAPDIFHLHLPKPVIYNLFGTHDSQDNDFVLTDADYIELIYDLIERKKSKFPNLFSYLEKGYLLFLGCNFPDWFFRLFVRFCIGNRVDMAKEATSRKAVIDTLVTIDNSRTVFIHNYGIQSINLDCNMLVNEIYQRFEKMAGGQYLVPKTENNKIFLSYCRADYDVVKGVSDQLAGKFIDHFLDTQQLVSGMDLHDTIKKEIDNACLILAFVSNNLSAASDYFCLEWGYALRKGKVIWPVFIDFVDSASIMLPCKDPTIVPRIREEVLNRYNMLGIKLTDDHQIPDDPASSKLNEIKEQVFRCRRQPAK